MWILQARWPSDDLVHLTLLDDARARWVTKGKRPRRALQVPGWQLGVFRGLALPNIPPGHATFGRETFHRLPRAAFWEHGPWNHRADPYAPGWGVSAFLDPRTGEFRLGWRGEDGEGDRGWFADRATEDDRIALDTLLQQYLAGPPPEGVYALDARL